MRHRRKVIQKNKIKTKCFSFRILSEKFDQEGCERKKRKILKSCVLRNRMKSGAQKTKTQSEVQNISKIKMNYSSGVLHAKFFIVSVLVALLLSFARATDATRPQQLNAHRRKCTERSSSRRTSNGAKQSRERYFLEQKKYYELCQCPFQVSNSTRLRRISYAALDGILGSHFRNKLVLQNGN